MRIFSTLLFICVIAAGASAQASKLKQGKQYMADLQYIKAIELYNQILENNDVAEAKINLAEAYRKVNDTKNAEYWYGQVVRLPQAEPIHKLYYGMMLQRNGKCDLAKEWYQQYVDIVPDDQRGQYLLRACDYETELMTRSAGIYEVGNVEFNSRSDDFSPAFYKAGLAFSTDRDTNPVIRRTHAWTGNPFLQLYYVDIKQTGSKEEGCGEYKFGRPEKFSNEINTKYHDASVAFSKNGEEIYFTRNNFLDGKKSTDDEGIMRLKIFYARGQGEGQWGEIQSLPFNSNEYSVAHPALSTDGGKLYFASDMPGGYGGMDLYVSEKDAGRWGPPMNLGPEVNTEGHEIFPYFASDGRLYFSSDGLIGLGGLDIYYIINKGNGVYTMPENLGYPINTNGDDFGIVFNEEGTCGFLSSNRDGGIGGDDIYSFKRMAIPVEVLVYDQRTDIPLEGAKVFLSCKNDTLTTDSDGKIRLDMKLNDCCDFFAGMKDYEPNKVQGCTKNLTLQDKLEIKIPLRRFAEFEVEGVVFDASTGLPIDGATVVLENTCGKPLAEPIFTTTLGRYYFKLDRDCCYKVKATKEGFFAGVADSICTTGMDSSNTFRENLYMQPTVWDPTTKTDPPLGGEDRTQYTYRDIPTDLWMDIETMLPAEGTYPDGTTYEKGVRQGWTPGHIKIDSSEVATKIPIPYILHIYYDFDQSYIREDAVPELEKLYSLLKDNERFIIEIGSHTDARGSNHYNQRLSQRRAEAVVRWLTDKGIERDRLVARGYGESVNVNDCINNVPCSEKDHQLNRRTEFKVIGCKGCIEPEKAVLSVENKNVKVDECKSCPF